MDSGSTLVDDEEEEEDENISVRTFVAAILLSVSVSGFRSAGTVSLLSVVVSGFRSARTAILFSVGVSVGTSGLTADEIGRSTDCTRAGGETSETRSSASVMSTTSLAAGHGDEQVLSDVELPPDDDASNSTLAG